MARTNNLTNFLTDVASAIKQKTGDNTLIPAANFDTEILSIETVGNYQNKSLEISQNGNYNLLPDTGYDAMSSVTITANVSDTSDATATENDIISPKTAYVNGEKITGNLPDPETLYSAVSQLPSAANVGKGVIQSVFDISTEASFNFQNPYMTTTEGFTLKTIDGINELPYSNVSIVIVQLNSQDFYAILFESNSMFITPKGAGWPCYYGGRADLIDSTVKVYHYQNNDWVLDTSKSQTISSNVARKTGSPDWGFGGVFGTSIKFPGKQYSYLTNGVIGTSYEVFDYYSGSSFYSKAFDVADATPPDMSDLTLDEVIQRNLYNGLDVYYSDKTSWSKIASSSKGADATTSDILNGKTAYKNNAKITGTMPNNGTLSYTPTDNAQTIPAGYTSGGTIAAMDITTSSDYTTCLGLSEQIIDGEPTPEYTELEYIESTGTQYINTGYKVNKSDNYMFEQVCSISNNNYAGSNGYMQWQGGITNNTKKTVKVTYENVTETIYVDNVQNSSTNWSSFNTSNVTIGIFKLGDENSGWHSSAAQSGKLYSFKLYSNNILLRDFIPVKDPNNVVCLYDKVSESYFYNAGTGTFIAGGEV